MIKTHEAWSKSLLQAYVEHMTITHDRMLWMILAGSCLIERVEKNLHDHKIIKVSMFSVGTASKKD